MEQGSSERRQLEFSSLEEVCSDARMLLEKGYIVTGKWNLAQACGHLEDWMRFPVEGFPKPFFPIRALLWMMKVTKGKSMFQKILQENAMAANAPTMPQTVKSAEGTADSAAVAGLESAAKQFSDHTGEYLDSPLFGKMSREQATKLQLIHCAHHLSFLLPRS